LERKIAQEMSQIVRGEAPALRVEEGEQRLVHAAGVGEAIGLLRRHRRLEERNELRRDIRPQELDGRILHHRHATQRLERGRRAEGVHAREHLVEHGAEREEVTASVDGLALRVLRAHVSELALELTRARVLDAGRLEHAHRLRDAEVGHLHLALEREEDVLRRDVEVNDVERLVLLVAAAMRVVEALRYFGRDVHRHLDGDLHLLATTPREERREVEPADVLHRHVVGVGGGHPSDHRAGGESEIEDLHDVRVREAHGELRLVDEHLDELLALGERREDALDDDDLLEAFDAIALGLEDLGHAALAEPLE
jgi:hypothetical protein